MAKHHILVVGDDPDTRIFISTLLEANGYRPTIVSLGMECIEKAKETKPSLIIMDMTMPKDSGMQMYRKIKTDDELTDIPMIILSAVTPMTYLHFQKKLDSFLLKTLHESEAYLEKPPESDEILQTIESLLAAKAKAGG